MSQQSNRGVKRTMASDLLFDRHAFRLEARGHCADCGNFAGFGSCDCTIGNWLPVEIPYSNTLMPLCVDCYIKYEECHFCRGEDWVIPPPRFEMTSFHQRIRLNFPYRQ